MRYLDENKRRDKIIKNWITINVHVINDTFGEYVARIGIGRINQRIDIDNIEQQHRLENKFKHML